MELILFTIIYALACITGRNGHYFASAGILMITGIFLFIYYSKKHKSILAPPAVFSISWIFCLGVSACKLSNLQTEWELKTWIAFYLVYICFILFWKLGCRSIRKQSRQQKQIEINANELFAIIIAFTFVSVGCFLFEAIKLRFIPLFTEGIPHAYSVFHISGVHYFTVLCVLVPSLSIFLFHKTKKISKVIPAAICNLFCLALPILMVSRFQLILAVGLAIIMWLFLYQHDLKRFLRPKYIFVFVIILLGLFGSYLFITVERAHSVEYLNSIFEMKNGKTPIFITQPYMYIANNFDNFDCMVKQLTEHTNGLRSAYPAFALTGLKFKYPELVSFPLFVTKEELTTVTMFYDAYYDFGIPGCVLFAAILGYLYSKLYRIVMDRKSDMILIIYTQLTAYLILAFFTTWFSNPTTWFYIGICIFTDIILILFRNSENRIGKRKENHDQR